MRNFFFLALIALAIILGGCYESLSYCEGEPKCISFSAEGGTMKIESKYWIGGLPENLATLKIGEDAYHNISTVSSTEDSIFVTARWLTTKQSRESMEKLEIIAQPNESKKTRTLYIIDSHYDDNNDDVIKVVQNGRK